MNNKDLFNAIDKAAEEYAAEVWDNTECERPVILRAEKKPRSVKRIVLSTAACAAAVAVIGAGVTVGVKYYSGRGALISGSSGSVASNIERNFAPASEILRVRDVGFYRKDISDEYWKILEDYYKDPMSEETLEKLPALDSIRFPTVYYYNDTPLDQRMLSDEADGWLLRYCLLSEEDRADETVPDEVKYLTGGGIVRYGDLGFLEDKYTEQELDRIKAYCATPLVFSSWPPEPDVYYYNDIPYHLEYLDRFWGFDVADAKNWLKWFCWQDEGTQEALSGYVPEEMNGRITMCNSEKPQEIVTYKGRALDVRSVDYDTEMYIKWYNSLSAALQAKVWYAPEEISGENLERYPLAAPDVKIIGPDGVPLTYEDLYSERTDIYKVDYNLDGAYEGFESHEISSNEIEQWDEIRCYGFVYLAEPGSDEFKRYNVGDEINGLKVKSASTVFRRFKGVSDPAMYYAGGEVRFEGTATVDILAFDNDNGRKCAISGLPIIDIDEKARAEGKIVPQQHSADEFAGDPDALLNEDSHCYSGGITGFGGKQLGQIQRGVEIEEINIDWRLDFDNTKWYQVAATLPKFPDGEKSPDGTSVNTDNEEKTPVGTAPNAYMDMNSVMFSQAKQKVKFVDVKRVTDGDFIEYRLEYAMPSETVIGLQYVYADGEVTVSDNSGDCGGIVISPEWYEKIESNNMVFWRSLIYDTPTVIYISESDVAYTASFESDEDLSKGIEKIISLL